MKELDKRKKVTDATIARFGQRLFRWGFNDCARLVAWHIKRFGHKCPKVGGYTSAIGAKKHLKAIGFQNLPDLIASLDLKEIGYARAMMGDIVSFPADDPIGAIGIVVGDGNMLCFHESTNSLVIMTMGKIDRCWSVM